MRCVKYSLLIVALFFCIFLYPTKVLAALLMKDGESGSIMLNDLVVDYRNKAFPYDESTMGASDKYNLLAREDALYTARNDVVDINITSLAGSLRIPAPIMRVLWVGDDQRFLLSLTLYTKQDKELLIVDLKGMKYKFYSATMFSHCDIAFQEDSDRIYASSSSDRWHWISALNDPEISMLERDEDYAISLYNYQRQRICGTIDLDEMP